MLKMAAVAICDICGKMQPARVIRGRYNEQDYVIPDGWATSTINKQVHLCPECAKKLKEAGRHA